VLALCLVLQFDFLTGISPAGFGRNKVEISIIYFGVIYGTSLLHTIVTQAKMALTPTTPVDMASQHHGVGFDVCEFVSTSSMWLKII